jgi:hypothetical protein
MENNEPFNVQGSFTGESGLTVTALIDFGIEDRDHGEYYVGSVSAKFQNNLEYLEEKGLISEDKQIENVSAMKLEEHMAEEQIYMDVENAIKRAVRNVFDLSPHSRTLYSPPETSDIDVSTRIPIAYGRWDVQENINYPKITIRDERDATGKFHVDQIEQGDLVQIDDFESKEEAISEYPNAEVLL